MCSRRKQWFDKSFSASGAWAGAKGKYNSCAHQLCAELANESLAHYHFLLSQIAIFNYYVDELEMIFLKRFDFLFDLNLSILHWINELIEHPAEIKVLSAPFDRDDFPGTFDLRKKWLPKNFQAESDFIRYTQVLKIELDFNQILVFLTSFSIPARWLRYCCKMLRQKEVS